MGGSVRQLAATFRDLRNYPQTLLFLLAYLFFNDGIQTVIGSSSLYGSEELGSEPEPADHRPSSWSSSWPSAARCCSAGWPGGSAR